MRSFALCLLLVVALSLPAFSTDNNIYFEMPIKLLREQPSAESPIVYELPIDVALVGMSEDGNWYRVKIAYDLMFLGHYEYTGWAHAPVRSLSEEAK